MATDPNNPTDTPVISLTTSFLRVTDVTLRSFSLVWVCSQPASAHVNLYADAAGNNLIKTLETFDMSHQFLKRLDLSDTELTKAIIGAVGDLDAHMLPDAKGYTSMLRYLNGISEAERQQMREEILGTRKSDFRAFAEILEKVKEEGIVKVLGSSKAIKEAFPDQQGGLNITKVL